MGKNNFAENVATAPYNFVPLNSTVISSDNGSSVITGIHDRYDYLERLTGYIECKLETLTPIYIRGGLTKEEIKAKKEAKDNSNFFSPAGQIRIPGSSLRGMIRTLVEIASWGKFGFFEDRNLYFRGFADNCKNLREEYDSQMKPYDKESKSSIYKMSAGYMVKEGFKYFIYPAEKTGSKDKQFYNIKIEEASEEIKKIGKKRENYNYYKLNDGRSIVVSGPMSNKKDPELSKKHDWVINKIDINIQNRIEIPEIDIQNYNRDETRGDKVPDLLKLYSDNNEVPCFYVEWLDGENKKRVSFGNTALFRISYQKSIGDHIPINGIKNKEKIDFANAIFGNTFEGEKNSDVNPIAGRVFFEDAKLVNPSNKCLMEEETPGILLGPKPTSFQLYLEQDSNKKDELKHYNYGARIRGNKFYWHKSGDKWEYKYHDQGNSNEKVKTKIRPVKPNIEFKFRIRYENLSENELGALLFTLKLPEGCAHKIGMGKPYGLGSVRITSELYVSKRNKRYLTLFNDDGWELAETKQSDGAIIEITSTFEEYILQKISASDKGQASSSLWETHRLKQLKRLLDFEKGNELELDKKIEYMSLKQFRDRSVLPIPERVRSWRDKPETLTLIKQLTSTDENSDVRNIAVKKLKKRCDEEVIESIKENSSSKILKTEDISGSKIGKIDTVNTGITENADIGKVNDIAYKENVPKIRTPSISSRVGDPTSIEPSIIHISQREKEVVKVVAVQLNFELSHEVFPLKIIDKERAKGKVLRALEMALNEGSDFICLPELSVCEDWIPDIKDMCQDVVVITGSYYDTDKHNVCKLLFDSYEDIPPQIKITPSPFEDAGIISKKMVPGDKLYIYDTRVGKFSVLICRDFINLRHQLRGKTDIIFVPSYNKEIKRFHDDANNHITNSPGYIVISNTSLYGGTSVFGSIRKEVNIELVNAGYKEKEDGLYKLCELKEGEEGLIIAKFNIVHKSIQVPTPANPNEEIKPIPYIDMKKIKF